jgi:hypothetical protein
VDLKTKDDANKEVPADLSDPEKKLGLDPK